MTVLHARAIYFAWNTRTWFVAIDENVIQACVLGESPRVSLPGPSASRASIRRAGGTPHWATVSVRGSL